LGVCSPELEARLAVLENAGKTTVILCAPSGPVAVFAVADTVRPESFAAVAALRALHVEPVMLTGDNPATARAIADQLGIQEARGNLMPEDKQAAVAELKTVMVRWEWSAMASTMRRRWHAPTSASRWAPPALPPHWKPPMWPSWMMIRARSPISSASVGVPDQS
jgi:hypothetical protein